MGSNEFLSTKVEKPVTLIFIRSLGSITCFLSPPLSHILGDVAYWFAYEVCSFADQLSDFSGMPRGHCARILGYWTLDMWARLQRLRGRVFPRFNDISGLSYLITYLLIRDPRFKSSQRANFILSISTYLLGTKQYFPD